MKVTLQKAGVWKRISAYLFDLVLTITLALGISIAVSAAFGYSAQVEKLKERYTAIETEYGVDFDISAEDYDKLSEEDKLKHEEANKAFRTDPEANRIYTAIFYTTVSIVSVSAFVAILIWNFLLPLLFGYGQTLGKKIFGLAVMRTNFTKVSNPVLFTRAIIGQFAIETMFPILIFTMTVFGMLGIVGLITLVLFAGLELFTMFSSKTNAAIHDLLTDTVVVDFASQMIFDTEEARDLFIAETQTQAEPKTEA